MALGYVWQNFDLYQLQHDIGGSPTNVPFPHVWNGSAWTLWFEFIAYISIIPLVFLPFIKKYQRLTITLAFIFSLGFYPLLEFVDAGTNMYWHFARLLPMFLAGALLYVWGDKIKAISSISIICLTLAVFIQLFAPEWIIQISQIIFAYGILGLACRMKVYAGYKHNLSYGVYIYAFPIQQTLMMLGAATLGILGNFIIVSIFRGI